MAGDSFMSVQAERQAQHGTNSVQQIHLFFKTHDRELNIIYARCFLDKKHIVTGISNPGKMK